MTVVSVILGLITGIFVYLITVDSGAYSFAFALAVGVIICAIAGQVFANPSDMASQPLPLRRSNISFQGQRLGLAFGAILIILFVGTTEIAARVIGLGSPVRDMLPPFVSYLPLLIGSYLMSLYELDDIKMRLSIGSAETMLSLARISAYLFSVSIGFYLLITLAGIIVPAFQVFLPNVTKIFLVVAAGSGLRLAQTMAIPETVKA